MSTPEELDYQVVLTTIRSWVPEIRLLLAQEILRSLRSDIIPSRGVPANQVLGIGAGEGPPPDDETVKRWIHEHRMEKYG